MQNTKKTDGELGDRAPSATQKSANTDAGIKDYVPPTFRSDDNLEIATTADLINSIFIVEEAEFFESQKYGRRLARVRIRRGEKTYRWITGGSAILRELERIQPDLPLRVKLVYQKGQKGQRYLSFTAPVSE